MRKKKNSPVLGIICSLIVAAVFLAVTFPSDQSANEIVKSSNLKTKVM